MFLHEAIEKILKENGRPMLDSVIADINKQRGLYLKTRKNVGQAPSAGLVRLRAMHRPNIFKVSGHMISLVEWEK